MVLAESPPWNSWAWQRVFVTSSKQVCVDPKWTQVVRVTIFFFKEAMNLRSGGNTEEGGDVEMM